MLQEDAKKGIVWWDDFELVLLPWKAPIPIYSGALIAIY